MLAGAEAESERNEQLAANRVDKVGEQYLSKRAHGREIAALNK